MPTNYQSSLLDVAKEHSIDELMGASFGPVGHACTSSQRSPELALHLTDTERGRHIRDAADHGFTFNYVMDAPCIGNREYDLLEKEKILDHLKWVSDHGASAVTVGAAFYIELVKHHLPHLTVMVSQSVYVDSVEKTRQFIQLGADGVIVHPDVNRSFSILRALGDYPEWGVRLVVNSGCGYHCVHRDFHALETGHGTSEIGVPSREDTCAHSFKNLPASLLQMRWIRPEDLSHYAKMGIERFVILGHQRRTSWIDEAINIWRRGRFDGNLLPWLDGGTRLSHETMAQYRLMTGKLDDFLSNYDEVNCHAGCHQCSRCEALAAEAVTARETAGQPLRGKVE